MCKWRIAAPPSLPISHFAIKSSVAHGSQPRSAGACMPEHRQRRLRKEWRHLVCARITVSSQPPAGRAASLLFQL
jgi:hypothetical protein